MLFRWSRRPSASGYNQREHLSERAASWQPIDVPNKDIPLIVAWKPHMATWPAAQPVTVKPTASLIGAPAESKASSAALSVIQVHAL